MWLKEIRPGAYRRRPLAPDPVRRALCAARQGRVSVGDDDDDACRPSWPACRRWRSSRRRRRTARSMRRRWWRRSSPGVETVYKCGGAQAVAAAAYGTETVRKAVKILGPGSPFVVAAKRLLADVIDTGTPAGPSESIVLADETADGRIAALDLLIEAEHGPDSSAYLVTHSRKVAEEAKAALPEHWSRMPEQRVAFSQTVLRGPRGGIVLTAVDRRSPTASSTTMRRSTWKSCRASRSCISATSQMPRRCCSGRTRRSRSGISCSGPNCVLPTSGWARSFGPLSVTDFLKRSSVGYVTRRPISEFAKHARVLAEYEGFAAHANAVSGDPRRAAEALRRSRAGGAALRRRRPAGRGGAAARGAERERRAAEGAGGWHLRVGPAQFSHRAMDQPRALHARP